MSTALISGEIQRELAVADAFLATISESVEDPNRCAKTPVDRDDVEHDMATLVFLMGMIDECSRRYTQAVSNDKAPYSEELDERIKSLWKNWIKLAMVTDDRVDRVRPFTDLIGHRYRDFQACLRIAMHYQREDFDHHAKAIISQYKFPLESFKDSKLPREFWDSEE